MGTGHSVDLSVAQDGSNVVTVPGGITFDDIEVTDIMLGSGANTMTVSATSPGTPGADEYVVTVVHGGGGSDRLIATGGGGPRSPLVLLGDTLQDGVRYNMNPSSGVINGNATQFSTSGNDLIDGSASPFGIIA